MDSHVFNLFLGLFQMLINKEFLVVLPVQQKLRMLILNKRFIENCELKSRHVNEVSNFSDSKEVHEKELMVEKHVLKPIIVSYFTSKKREVSQSSSVGKECNHTSS